MHGSASACSVTNRESSRSCLVNLITVVREPAPPMNYSAALSDIAVYQQNSVYFNGALKKIIAIWRRKGYRELLITRGGGDE